MALSPQLTVDIGMFKHALFSALSLILLTFSSAIAEDVQKPVPGRVTMLDLGSQSCIPCKMMVPVLEKVKKHYEGTADILFLDVNEHPELKKTYAIEAIPTQIFYDKNGQERARHVGFLDENRIIKKMDALLSENNGDAADASPLPR